MTTSGSPRTAVTAPNAPTAIGPYSHAVRHGDVLYCSGMLPLDPADGAVVADSPAAETACCLRNLQAVCQAVGTDLSQALRLTVYTTQLDRFPEINEAYSAFFGTAPPARVTIGVASLPKGVSVEIDAVVAVG